MTPPTSTETRPALIALASELIQRRGYASFSYRDLAEGVGIRTASIHYHFPSKEDLGLAVIASERERMATGMAELERAHSSVPDRLGALLDHAAGLLCQGCICPLGSLQAEYGVLPERMQEALRQWAAEQRDIYARWLAEGRERGELRFPGEPSAQAELVACLMQAGLQRARTGGQTDFTILRNQLLASMQP